MDSNTLTTTPSRSTTLSHKHRHSPPPPIPSRRNSRFSFNLGGAIPTPELLSSLPSASHYVGAPPTGQHDKHPHGMHRRSSSKATDDPEMMEGAYKVAMDDLKEMYCGRVTMEILDRRWAKDAIFEDPWLLCKGFDQYAPHWLSIPRLYTHFEQTSMRILSANLDPHRVVYAQTMHYTVRWLGIKKEVASIIIVDFDDEFKIIRLVDQWDGEQPPTRWGTLYWRKFNAKLIPWLVRVPKTKSA